MRYTPEGSTTLSAGAGGLLCPDCGTIHATRDELVSHRELEHPPTSLSITGAGQIDTQAAFGTDPKDSS